jgi:carbon monoxide dehydrogenase subunit G
VDGDSFSGTVKVKLGPVSLQYAGKGRFLERDETAHLVVLEANGSDKRGNGTAGATVHARLEPLGDNETRVVVDTDLKVTGRPAQFGRGVLQDVGSRIIEQFATCLATRMSASGDESTGEPTVEPASDDSASGDSAAVEATSGKPAAGGTTSMSVEEPTAAAASGDTTGGTTSMPAEEPTAATAVSARAATSASRRNATTPTPAPRLPPPAPAAELDLNRVVLPALARRYGPPLLAVLLALIVVRLILRRRR